MKRLLVATLVFASVATISQAQLRSSASAPSGIASSANVSGWHAGSPFISNTPRSQARTFPVRPRRDVTTQICTQLGGCFQPTFPWTTTIGQSDFDRRHRHNADNFFGRVPAWNGSYGFGAPYYFPQSEADLSDVSDNAERATADREQMTDDLQDQYRKQELARQYAELHAADVNTGAQSHADVGPGQTSVEPPGPALLILRDGRRLQIENYAVTRNKVLTFGSNAQPTIMMSEVDVPATLKANQEAGFKFVIPGMTQ